MKVRLVDGFEFEAEFNGNNIIPSVEVADGEKRNNRRTKL